MTDTTAEPTGFDDFEFVEDDETPTEWPAVKNIEFDVISTVEDVDNLAQGLDIFAATFGRFGLEGFTLLAKDVDDPERSWVVKGGKLYTSEQFVAQFELAVDSGLSEEEEEALRESDLPVAPE